MVDLADLRARIEVELDPATAAVKSFLSVFGNAGQRVTTDAQQIAAAASGLDHALTATGQAAGQAAARIADFVPGAHGATTALQQTAQAAEQAGQSMQAVKGHGLSAAGGFEAMGSAAQKALGILAQIGLAAQGIEAIATAAKSVGNFFGVGLANELEVTSAKMLAFTKDAGLTADILKYVRAEADRTPFSFREMSDATGALIPVARQARVALTDLTKQAEILAALNPAEGLKGAAFSLREAMSGDWTSIVERFNLPRSAIKALKDEGVPAMEIITRVMKDMGADMTLVSNMAETTAGRFSTFKDAIDGVRLVAGQIVLTQLKAELADMAGWMEANKRELQEFARSLGENTAAGIRGFAAAIATVKPYVQDFILGWQTLAMGFQMAPPIIQNVTLAVGGLAVALAALSLVNPVTAIITGAALAIAGVSAMFRKATDEVIANQAAMDAAGGTWNRNAQFAADLARQLAQMAQSGKSNADQVEALRKVHENLGRQWNELSSNFNQNQDALAGINSKMRETERAAAQFGVTLVKTGDGATEVRGRITDINAALAGTAGPMSDATAKGGPLADALAKIKKEGTDAAGALDAAMKAASDFARQASGIELVLDRQGQAIKTVAADARAAFDSKARESIDKWIDRAHEAANQTSLTGEALQGLHNDLEILRKGGPGAEGALKRIEQAQKDILKPIESASAAYAEEHKLMDATGKEALGLGQSLESLKSTFKTLVDSLLVALGRVPAGMAEFVKVTQQGFEIDKDKAEAAGQGGVIAFIKGITGKEPVVKSDTEAALQRAVSAAQGAALTEMTKGGDAAGQGGVNAMVDAIQKGEPAATAAGLNLGVASVLGAMQGIDSQLPALQAKAAEVGAIIVSAGKVALDAHSPSRRTHKEIGEAAGQGAIDGLSSKQAELAKTAAETFGAILEAGRTALEILPQLVDLEITPATDASLQRLAAVMRAGMGAVFAEFSAWNAMGVAHVKDVSDAGKGTFDAFSGVVDVVKKLADLDTDIAAAEPRVRQMARLIENAMGELFHATVAWNQFGVAHVKEVSEAGKSTFEALQAVMETLDRVRTLPEPNPGDWRRLGEMAVDAAGVMAWLAFNINSRIRQAAAQVKPVNEGISSTFDAIGGVLEVLDKVRTLPEPSAADWFRIGDAASRAVEVMRWLVWNVDKKLAEAAPRAGEVLSNAGTVLDTVGKLLDLMEPLRTGRDLNGQDWDRIADAIHVAIAAVASAIDDPALTQRLKDAAAGAGAVASAAGTILDTVGKVLDLMEPLRTGRALNGRDWVLIADGAHVAIAAVASVLDDPELTQALKDGAAKAGEVASAAGTILDTVGRVLELMEPLRTARSRNADDWPKVADAIHVAIASVAATLANPELTQEVRDGAAAAGSVASAAGTVLEAVKSVLDTMAAVRLARVPDPADVARLAGLIEIGIGALAAAVAQASQELRDGAAGASSVASAAGSIMESVRGIIDTFRALDTLPADAINPEQLAQFVVMAAQAVRDALREADDQLRAGAEDAGKVAASATQVIGSLKALAELFDASRTVSPATGAEMARVLVAQASMIVRAFIDAMPELKANEQRLISEVAPAIQSVTAAVKGVLDLMLAFSSQSTEKTQEAAQTASKNADGTAESLTQSSRAWERTWTSFDLSDRLQKALPAVRAGIKAVVALQFEILQQFQEEMSSVDRKGLAVAAEVASNAKQVQDAIKGAIDLVMGLGDVVAQDQGRDAFDKYATALQQLRLDNQRALEDIDAQIASTAASWESNGTGPSPFDALNKQRARIVADFQAKQAQLERQLFADQNKAAADAAKGDPKEKVKRGIENLKQILDQVLTALGDVARDYQTRFAGQQQQFSDMSATVSGITASITGLTGLLATLGDDTTGKAARIQAGASALPGLVTATTTAMASIATVTVPEGYAAAVETLGGAVTSAGGLVTALDTAFEPAEGLREKAQAWWDYLSALLDDVAKSAHTVENQAQEATTAILAALSAVQEALAALGRLKAAQGQLAGAGYPTLPVPANPPTPPDIPGFANGVTNFMGGLAMVGERGPELMYLPAGTGISSHEDTMAMLRTLARSPQGMSGSGTVNNYYQQSVTVPIQGPVYGIHNLQDMVNQAIKTGQRTGQVRPGQKRRTG